MTSFIASPETWRRAWDENWQREDLLKVHIAVAYCTRRGAQEVQRMWDKRQPSLELLVGLNDGVTDVDAQKFLFEWAQAREQVDVRAELQSGSRFHPKVYVFVFPSEIRVLVGSYNLTNGAFERNSEAAFHHSFSDHEKPEILSTLTGWWKHAKPIAHPDNFPAQVERIGVRKTLIELMRRGAFVEIEAHVSALKAHFDRDVFGLGRIQRVQSDSITAETSRHQTIWLLSPEIRKKLENQRAKAHDNCARFSVRCGKDQFVTAKVFDKWESEHKSIENSFRQALEIFHTSAGRNQQRTELAARLPKEIDGLVKEIQKRDPQRRFEDKDFKFLCELALRQFDERAPHFPEMVRLHLQVNRHSLPSLLGSQSMDSLTRRTVGENQKFWGQLPDEESGFEAHLRRYAETNEKQILRQWMKDLVCTPRQVIVDGFHSSTVVKTANLQSIERRKAAEQLQPLDFLSDCLVEKVIPAFSNAHQSLSSLRNLRDQAQNELQIAAKWHDEALPFDVVLEQFASITGWK